MAEQGVVAWCGVPGLSPAAVSDDASLGVTTAKAAHNNPAIDIDTPTPNSLALSFGLGPWWCELRARASGGLV